MYDFVIWGEVVFMNRLCMIMSAGFSRADLPSFFVVAVETDTEVIVIQ